MLEKLKLLYFIWKHRKDFNYIRKTGKVPLCSCSKFYKTGNCKHIEKLRLDFKKWIGK